MYERKNKNKLTIIKNSKYKIVLFFYSVKLRSHYRSLIGGRKYNMTFFVSVKRYSNRSGI